MMMQRHHLSRRGPTATAAALPPLLLLAALFAAAAPAAAGPFGSTFSGEGTYYGLRTRGFGHCSFHFHGHGASAGYLGTPLAVNAPQYTGASICGLCVRFRGTGGGAGGNPIASDWQPGFICDECPECKHGDLDLQTGGDGRWKIEWQPVQCPVGASALRYGFQGGNPYYKKLQVANARVPVAKVEILRGGGWQQLVATIDNYHEYHGPEGEAWGGGGCASVRVTSILGDSVEDKLCCSTGTCEGAAQLPCRSDLPGDCAGAGASGGGAGGGAGGGGDDTSNKRVAAGQRTLSAGAQCGGAGFGCAQAGACRDSAWPGVACPSGTKCARNDAKWWGCKA